MAITTKAIAAYVKVVFSVLNPSVRKISPSTVNHKGILLLFDLIYSVPLLR